jgi:hypothetical protein
MLAALVAASLAAPPVAFAGAEPSNLEVTGTTTVPIAGTWSRNTWFPVRERYRAAYIRNPRRRADIASYKVAWLDKSSRSDGTTLGLAFWLYRVDCRRDLNQAIRLGMGTHTSAAEHAEVRQRALRNESSESAIYVNGKPFWLFANSSFNQDLERAEWRVIVPGSQAAEELDAVCARKDWGR